MLAGRQEQIQIKMEELRRRQQESLQRREELLQDMEKANQLTQREKQETQRQKELRAEELGAQVPNHRACEAVCYGALLVRSVFSLLIHSSQLLQFYEY